MSRLLLNRGYNLEEISKRKLEEEVNFKHGKSNVATFFLIVSY